MLLSSISSSSTGLGLGRARAALPSPRRHRRQPPLRRRPLTTPTAAAKKDDASQAPITDPQAAQRQRDLDLEDDLLQHPDRCSWYEARFAGDGQPDWHPASVVANEAACPSMRGGANVGGGGGGGNGSSPLSWRLVTLAFEASRERVPLRNAYTEPGQAARMRSGPAMTEEEGLAVATPPPYEGEVLLPPVPRRRPTVVVAEARRRRAEILADQTLLQSTTGGESGFEDDDEDDNKRHLSSDDDPFDFDAPWRDSPYYSSGALPTPRQTDKLLREALFRVRGDIFANEVKTVREPVSAIAPLQLLVSPKQAPELCATKPGDLVAVGPFEGQGLDLLRSGLLAVFRYRTLVLFVGGPEAGPGAIATARALLLSAAGRYPTSLLPAMRSGGVVVYYWAPNGASVCFGQEDFDAWGSTTTMAYLEEEEEEGGGDGGQKGASPPSSHARRITRHRANVRVVTTTRGFADAFDGDDDLVFDPDETAAIVLTGGDASAEQAARQVCRDAEIGAVVSDAAEAPRNVSPEYLSAIPKAFSKWAEQSREMREAAAARDEAQAAEKQEEKAGAGEEEKKKSASASSR
jgi:hypothetical protein